MARFSPLLDSALRASSRCVCVLWLVQAAFTPSFAHAGNPAGSYLRESIEFPHGGLTRNAVVVRPKRQAAPLPLLLMLHGGTMDPDTTEHTTGLTPLAESNGFLLVYPAGIERRWNDGREVAQYRAMNEKIDDVGFLTTLVQDLIDRGLADPERLAIAGPSNGAMMTLRMLCESPLRFSVAVPVIGSLPEPLRNRCQRNTATEIHLIGGDTDPLVPYTGGALTIKRKNAGRVLGFEETAAMLASLSDCREPAAVEKFPDRVPADGTTISRRRWSHCGNGKSVELITIAGGGHRWPGTNRLRPVERAIGSLLGTRSEEIDLSKQIVAWIMSAGAGSAPVGWR